MSFCSVLTAFSSYFNFSLEGFFSECCEMHIICYIGACATTLYVARFFGERAESTDLVTNPEDGRGNNSGDKKKSKIVLKL